MHPEGMQQQQQQRQYNPWWFTLLFGCSPICLLLWMCVCPCVGVCYLAKTFCVFSKINVCMPKVWYVPLFAVSSSSSLPQFYAYYRCLYMALLSVDIALHRRRVCVSHSVARGDVHCSQWRLYVIYFVYTSIFNGRHITCSTLPYRSKQVNPCSILLTRHSYKRIYTYIYKYMRLFTCTYINGSVGLALNYSLPSVMGSFTLCLCIMLATWERLGCVCVHMSHSFYFVLLS